MTSAISRLLLSFRFISISRWEEKFVAFVVPTVNSPHALFYELIGLTRESSQNLLNMHLEAPICNCVRIAKTFAKTV
jgi:hypothetical protein